MNSLRCAALSTNPETGRSKCKRNAAPVKAGHKSRPLHSSSKPSRPSPDTIPDTNVASTNLLWRRVKQLSMSSKGSPGYLEPTRSSRLKAAPGGGSSPEAALLTNDSASSSTIFSSPSKSRDLRLTDEAFRPHVFERYGISITVGSDLQTPYQHFGTEDLEKTKPLETIREWYKQRHPHCDVWLSLDEDDARFTAQQYQNMSAINSNEAKLSHRAKLYFLKEDIIYGPSDATRCSTTYCEFEWAPSPDNQHLLCPPVVNNTGLEFGFTSNPDCTYWLTTRRMNLEYSSYIGDWTFVLPNANATAPYLTIEFKKDDSSFDAALNQLAVSATMYLYSRFRLRYRRLQVSQGNLSERNFRDIKHYGIAFRGSEAHFFIACPRLSFDSSDDSDNVWKGCQLRKFVTYDAQQTQDVIAIRRWINEIHNWGMGEHSRQFMLDVKGILRTCPGGERVSLLPEEMEAIVQSTKITQPTIPVAPLVPWL